MTDDVAKVAALRALADRCEVATGPDRNLDCAIYATVHPELFGDRESAKLYARLNWTRNWADWYFLRDIGLKHYTDSIDAAMTLMPKGWVLGHLDWWPHRDGHMSGVNMDDQGKLKACSAACSPAMAITAAALRARAHLEQETKP